MMNSQTQPRPDFARYLPLIVTLLGGASLSLVSFFLARQMERDRMQSDFENQGSELVMLLERRVAANLDVLRSVRAFFQASDEVDQQEFALFTESAMQAFPRIEFIAWTPRVRPDELERHLKRAEALGVPRGYVLRDAQGQALRPTTRENGGEELFPVMFINHRRQKDELRGLDLGSVDKCEHAMRRALEENRSWVSEPVELDLPGGRRRFDCVVFTPIYQKGQATERPEQRRQALTGYAVGMLQLDRLMDGVLAELPLHGQEIQLSGEKGAPPIYRTERYGAAERQSRAEMRIEPWEKQLTLGTRQWTVRLLPTAEFERAQRQRQVWIVPTVGMGFTMLLAAYLHSLSGRAERVQRMVKQRTGELMNSNENLQRQIEERRQAEQALRESEAFYHALVESLPQNIFRKDLEGRITFANQRYCAILGRTLEEVKGKSDLDLFPRDLAEKYRRDDQAVLNSGLTFDEVEEHVTPTGETLYVHVIKIPLLDASGRRLGIQGVFWDVTARERAERLLQQTNRQLAEAVQSERQARETLQKTQSTLIQSEKLAGLGQMVAGVAHEINNPLAFVSNNVAVLQRDVKAIFELLELYRSADEIMAAHAPRIAERIAEQAERTDLPYVVRNVPEVLVRSREGLRRIQQIVKDLRDFARLDESDLHEVDINNGIESTLNIIRGHARKKQIELVFEAGCLPPVLCLPAKLNQVVMNLVCNAIDASPNEAKVLVRTHAADGMVRIEVQDQGHGIDPAIVERIFDPFFTTKPPGEGTGLGLSISYGIIQQHGGNIAVESSPGAGSKFVVSLPIRREGN